MKMFRFILSFILIASIVHAVDIGSDTAVNRFDTQQIAGNGDRVAGFAALYGGLALANSSTSATFDSFFQISGEIALNFGTLILNQDLVFQDVTSFTSTGNIQGNGQSLILSPQISKLPTSSSAQAASCSISLVTSNATSAQVNSTDWNASGQYLAIATNDPGGATNQVVIYSWNGSSLSVITGVDIDNSALSVRWHPTNDWIAVGRTGAGGSPFEEIFIYSFNGAILTLLDSLTLVFDTANAVSWRPDGNYLAVATTIGGGQLRVYPVSGGGVLGTPVTAGLATTATSVSWNSDGTYLAVGITSTAGSDFLVYAFNGVALTLNAGANITATVNDVSWCKGAINTDIIAVGSEVGTGSTLKLYRHSPGSVTALPLSVTTTSPINTVDWRTDGMCLAVGFDSNASGEVRTYEFASDDISLASDLERSSNVFDVRWSRDGSYLATGDAIPSVSIFQSDTVFVDISRVRFSDLHLYLNNDLNLYSPGILFQGESVIDGRRKTLSLSSTVTLVVDSDASLLLKNVTISGITADSFRGTDDTSTFSFDNVCLEFDQEFEFSTGRWDILNALTITGTNSITYSSQQPITIHGADTESDPCDLFYQGELLLNGITFNYAPSNNDPNLLIMESVFSRLTLINTIFNATSLNLIKGALKIDGNSIINGITSISLGDGLAIENNLSIEICPAAVLDLQGAVQYNNV